MPNILTAMVHLPSSWLSLMEDSPYLYRTKGMEMVIMVRAKPTTPHVSDRCGLVVVTDADCIIRLSITGLAS